MADSMLLLAPVAILAVVLLLGFLGCNNWPGVGPPSGTGQSHLTLEANAPGTGPDGVQAITGANFTAVTDPALPSQPTPAQEITDKLWRSELTLTQTPPEKWTIEVEVLHSYRDESTEGTIRTDGDITGTFDKTWGDTATETWTFYLNYHPEEWGHGELYKLEEVPFP